MGKMKRHLMESHKEEDKIKVIKELYDDLKAQAIGALTSLGDYQWNHDKKNEGKELLVARRPNKKQIIKSNLNVVDGTLTWPAAVPESVIISNARSMLTTSIQADGQTVNVPVIHNYNLPTVVSADEYVPCTFCLKELKADNIKKHRCPTMSDMKNKRGFVKECRAIVPDIPPLASERLRKYVLKHMNADNVLAAIKLDKILILFGNALAKYHTNPQDPKWISRHLKVLASIHLAAKKKHPEISQFSQLLHNTYADAVTGALEELAGYDNLSADIKKAFVTKEASYMLNKVTEFYVRFCIKSNLSAEETGAERFQKLMVGEFKHLNKQSRKMVVKRAKQKPIQELPSTEDITLLITYAEIARQNAFNALSEGFNAKAFHCLNETTLLLIQVFNRKRRGELSRLELEDLNKSCIFELPQVISGKEFENLSEVAKKKAGEYVRVQLTNKLGLRNVGLILHRRLLTSIDLLFTYRAEASIAEDNRFVFAKWTMDALREGYYDAGTALSKYARLAGVSKPELMLGTLLRKQVATIVYAADIGDDQLKDLANFLGHAYDIHKNHYRQNLPVKDLLCIAPLLQAAQGNPQADSNGSNEVATEATQGNASNMVAKEVISETKSDDDYTPSDPDSNDSDSGLSKI